jgi:predicted ATP-dependent endonuclease of OLD family
MLAGGEMKLKKVHVTEFQSVLDSNEFEISDITCLVGKNEAGKTALLQALYRLNPIVKADAVYSVVDDYPRWNVGQYEIMVKRGERKHAIVVRAIFELDKDDVAEVAAVFGEKALKGETPILELSDGYEGTRYFDFQFDETASLQHLVAQREFAPTVASELHECPTLERLIEILAAAEATEDVTALLTLAREMEEHGGVRKYLYTEILKARVPKFLYFDEYYQMVGRANLEALKQRVAENKLERSDYPLLGLIHLARLSLDELMNPERTRELKNKLEGAGNHLTKNVVKYWSQNRYLQLRFDVRPGRPKDPVQMRTGTNIWGDVYDSKHGVTTELGTRSRGFVWFFSFLAWYSDVRREGERVILLLDEPGLSLHGKAQEDLLRYFEAEIKGTHQLIYTTHSPFMVDATKFDRVRIVQDLRIEKEGELPPEQEGTKVLRDVLDATGESLFPLQGALGYEIYQTLFIGPNSLVVEGVSDLIYLQTMSALLQERGRIGLSPKWTVTPVGGSDKVPTFVALIGAQKHLNVAVLVDFQKKDHQVIENLYKRKLLEKKQVLTFVDFVAAPEADIEDMFEAEFFLKLVNAEFADCLQRQIKIRDLDSRIPRILARLEAYLAASPLKSNSVFNHFRPARYLSERVGGLKSDISDSTLDRFEAAFKRLNDLV